MVQTITVSASGGEDFTTITEAAASVPADGSAVIHIRNGFYWEKIFLRNRFLRLEGEDPLRTVISWQDGARRMCEDGEKIGTFRSYTLYLGGERAELKNLTVQNTAGGETAGQAIAVYADATFARFEAVRMTSRQDTLFLAPLPLAPREDPRSFRGPGEFAPRAPRRDYFKDCYLEGDVDFIFGGAEAAFCGCKIFSRSQDRPINGYVTAASTPEKQDYGFLFDGCLLASDCAPGSVFLGRPWRKHAMTAFLECSLGPHIVPCGWSLWSSGAGEERTVRFSEYRNHGAGAKRADRPGWAPEISSENAARVREEIEKLAEL